MRNTVDPMPIHDDEFCESTTLSFKKRGRKPSDPRRNERMKMKRRNGMKKKKLRREKNT